MLHTIREWEDNIDERFFFEVALFNKERKVKSVKGKLRHHLRGWINVHWDGFGKCYVGVKRVTEGDINFDGQHHEKDNV